MQARRRMVGTHGTSRRIHRRSRQRMLPVWVWTTSARTSSSERKDEPLRAGSGAWLARERFKMKTGPNRKPALLAVVLHRLVRHFFGKIEYPGYNCGCCGKWINEVHFVPARMSVGWKWDTIGLCAKCADVPNARGMAPESAVPDSESTNQGGR